MSVGEMRLLPCAKDVCQECAVDHAAGEPHNAQSMYYQYKFFGQHGRWPTWKDAIAHCDDKMRAYWEFALKRKREWTEPSVDDEAGAVMDRPSSERVCYVCDREHPVDAPHDPKSTFYKLGFWGEHGHLPTWKDAIAHCDALTKVRLELDLRQRGLWPTESPSPPAPLPTKRGERGESVGAT